MKRLFCLLLSIVFFIPLTACSTYDSANELETTDNVIADPSNIDAVDWSYENVAKLTDFKCYVSYQEKTLTVEGTRAKDLYNLVWNEMSKQEHTPTSSDGNYVYLVFYNSKEEFPFEESINLTGFRGTYTIYDDGLLVFSGSPFHSAAFHYKLEPDLYNSVIDMISGDLK